MCWMFLVDQGQAVLKGSADAGSRRGPDESELLLKLSPKTLKRRYPIICNHVGELYRQDRALHRFLRRRKIEKFMAVLLKKEGRSIGILSVGRDPDAQDFTRGDLRSLTALGSMLVVGRLRAAEIESKRAQSFLGGIVDNTPNPIFIKNRDHRYVVLNQAFSELLGHSRDEMLGKSDYDIFPKDQADFFRKKDDEMFRSGKVIDIPEEPATDKDGNLHYVHTKKAPLRDSSGKITHLVGIIEDITERRRAEEALRESESRYRTLFEGAAEGIIVADAESKKLLYANPAVCRMLGYAQKELTRMRVPDIHPRESLKRVISEFEAQSRGEKTLVSDLPFRRKDGAIVYADVNTASVVIDGRPRNVGFFTETTKRREIQAALVRRERIARQRARVLAELHQLERIDDILTRVCRAVRDSGLFERAVMTLHEPGGLICHIGQAGLPAGAVRKAQRAAPMDRKLKERITSKRFRISNSFFVPSEAGFDFSKSGRHIPQKKKVTSGGDWQPGDELFVPLRDFSGKIMGYLSVDTPTDGCRPDVATVQALEMLVEAAASRVREMEAQEVLKQERDFSQSILETANSLIVCLDGHARITVFNQECERVTGYRSEEVIGKRWPELCLPPDHRHSELESFVKWVRAHPSDRYEGPIVTKSGEIRTILWSNTAIFGPKESEMVAIAIGHDVTERKRAEEALKKSEEKFRSFMETASDLMNITDEKGNITYVNESMVRTLGYSKERMIGMHITQLLTKEALEKDFKPNWGEFTANGKISIATTFAAKDGKEIYGELKAVATYDKDGKLAGTRAVFHDLTERRRVEEKLLESEIKHRTLVEQLPAVTYTAALDESSTTLYISPQIEKILGISPAEYKADPDFWVKHLYPDDRDRVLNEVSRSHRTGRPFHSEYRMVSQNGQLVWFRDDATIVRDDKGNRLYLQGVMFDITDHKQAQEELQKSEYRYRGLFEDSPISLWEEDFSEVKKYIDRLRNSGVTDFRSYFERRPDAVAKCASMVKVIDVNTASLRLYRARSKEDLKSGLAKIFARESYYPFTEELVAIAEGKTRFQKDADIRTLRRETRHVSVTWSVAPGHEETLSKVVVAITDVTEAKEAEEALRRSEEMYRTLVETAQEGIGIVDAKENLVFVNRAFAGMLGYRKDELLGKNLQEISPETQYDVFRDETGKRRQGKPSRYEITLLTKKRKPKPMYVSAAPLWNADGSFRGTLGVVSDLTEIKKAREYNILLGASRSLSRTLKFDQVLKLGAEKMAQALNAERCTVMLPAEAGSGSSIRVQLHPFPNKKKGPLSAWTLRIPKKLLSSYKRSLRAQVSTQIPDLGSDLAPDIGKRIMRKSGMVSALLVPMFSRNTMLGVFHVGMRKKTRTFSLEEEQLARTMANQVAVALQNCRLMEDLRAEHSKIIEQSELLSTQYREQKMMFELTQALSSSRNLKQLMSSACRKVAELLNTERSSIGLLEPGGERASVRAVHVRGKRQPGDLVGFSFTAETFPQLTDTVLRHKPFIINDASVWARKNPAWRYFSDQGIKSLVAVPLVCRGKSMGLLTTASMTEIHRYSKDEIRLLQTISNPIAVTIENYRLMEDLKQRLAQIREQAQTLEKQTREQEILLRVSQALSRAMDLDEVSQVGSRVVGSALGVERCAISLLRDDGKQFEIKGLYCKEEPPDRKIMETRFPWADVPDLFKSVRKGKPFVIYDTSDIPPESATAKYFRKTGIKSALGTGMFFGKKLVGILSITSLKERKTFTPEETRLIQTMANQIAVAVENARLQQMVEKHAQELKNLYSELLNAQESERGKIARELHDQVGQMLQAMKMNLDWVQQALTSKPEKLEKIQDWLSDTEELLAQTIEDIRNLTFDLRPSMLDDFGLIPALRSYVENFSRRSNLKVSLKTGDKEYRFPPEVVIALYRIIQEALTNVAKHAKASLASVSVSQRGSTAVLSVRDNGVGFDSDKWLSVPKGMGLLNIKERVDMLGGSFEIISRPRKGTKLNIQIPFSGGAV